MIKLTIAIALLAAGGIVWLRSEWGRSKNKNASKQIIDDLKSGKFVIESYADSLNILISSIRINSEMDWAAIKQKLNLLAGKKLLEKFQIDYADSNENNKAIVIGEAISKDYIQEKEINIFFPCWLYVELNADNNELQFKSTFPESKDHHYLLEDLANELYKQMTNV